jgi:hypothetical protein
VQRTSYFPRSGNWKISCAMAVGSPMKAGWPAEQVRYQAVQSVLETSFIPVSGCEGARGTISQPSAGAVPLFMSPPVTPSAGTA